MIGNSVGTKSSPTQNVLSDGLLAKQFAQKGGQGLVDELASERQACWTYGEIRFTGSHEMDKDASSPKHICHFCVPREYKGDETYLVSD